MRQTNQLLMGEADHGRQATNVLLAAVLILVTAAWLIAYATGKLSSMIEVLHPYLPGWFSLVNALLVPVTAALAALRSVPFRANCLFALVMLAQASLLGLTIPDHPVVKLAVTIFLYYESFVLIPRWNHRIVETAKGGSVLGLQQLRTSTNNQEEDHKMKG